MRYARLAIVLAVLVATLGAQAPRRALLPTMGEAWYPMDPDQLRKDVESYCTPATPPTVPPGRVCAIIVPHAPLQTSGAIAGAAFSLLKPDDFDRVIVLYPSHYTSFNACSIPGVDMARTPLGDIPFDRKFLHSICNSVLFESCSVSYSSITANPHKIHENEYALQAVLPFLQVRLKDFTLCPIAVGSFEDSEDRLDLNAIKAAAVQIRKRMTNKTLIVVSSDFTHYGDKFRYTPFPEDTLASIEKLDRIAFDLIVKKDLEGFLRYLQDTENVICGRNALAILISLLSPDAQGTLLQYEISGAKNGNPNPSISFASLVFTQPTRGSAAKEPTP